MNLVMFCTKEAGKRVYINNVFHFDASKLNDFDTTEVPTVWGFYSDSDVDTLLAQLREVDKYVTVIFPALHRVRDFTVKK